MPADVIDRVHALAQQQNATPGLVFLDHNQIPDDDLDDDASDDSDYAPSEDRTKSHGDDSEYNSDNDDGDDDGYDNPYHDDGSAGDDSVDDNSADDDGLSSENDSDSSYWPMSNHSDNDSYCSYDYDSTNTEPDDWTPIGITGVKTEHAQDANIAQQIKDDNYYPPKFYHDTDDNNNDSEPPESAGVGSESNSDEPPESAGVGTHPDHDVPPESTGLESQDELNQQEELDCDMDTQYGPHMERYNMRQCKECDYSHLFVETVDEEDVNDTQEFQTPQNEHEERHKTVQRRWSGGCS